VRVRQQLRDALHRARDSCRGLRKCHPYYTGKQKLMDTAGRVERFRQKYGTEKAAG